MRDPEHVKTLQPANALPVHRFCSFRFIEDGTFLTVQNWKGFISSTRKHLTVPKLIDNKKITLKFFCTIICKLCKGDHWLRFLVIGLKKSARRVGR